MFKTRKRRTRAPACFLALAWVASACSSQTTPGFAGAYGFDVLAFVQRAHPGYSASLLAPDVFRPGGRALLLEPAAATGKLTDLSRFEQGDVLGLDVAPDGEGLVFSLRTAEFDSHHLIAVDLKAIDSGQACFTREGDLGPACRQLTFGPGDDTRPFYLSDGRIAFVRSHPWGPVDWQGRGRARVLYAVEADGSGLRRLDYSPGHALGARPMPDGGIRLTRVTQSGPAPRFLPLWIDPAGARAQIVDGPDLPGVALVLGAQRDEAGRLLAACVSAAGTWQAGTLCQREAEGIWSAYLSDIPYGDGCSPGGRLRDPVALGKERYLVSYAKTPNGCLNSEDEIRGLLPDFGLAVLDAVNGERYPLYSDPDRDELSPRPVQARALLDSGVLPPLRPEGSCAEGGILIQGMVDREDVVAVRLLQAISGAEAPFAMELGGLSQGAICAGDAGQTLWAPVQSVAGARAFKLRAPAQVPVKAQYLDAYGAAVYGDELWWGGADCARFGDGESLGALEITALDGSELVQRDFDFRRDVQPILNRSCVANGCHDGDTAAGTYVGLDNRLRGLDLRDAPSGRASVAYNNLLAVDRRRASDTGVILEEVNIYVTPGSARQSRLAQRLGVPCRVGDCAGGDWAPWAVPAAAVHPTDQPGFAALVTQGLLSEPSAEDRWLIVEWIDAGAAYHGREAGP